MSSIDLGAMVSRSKSIGTGTKPCSLMICTISGMLIPVMMISDPTGNFLA